MELDGLQTTSIEWLRRDFIWTESHIDEKDERFTYESMLNKKADDLATKGRGAIEEGIVRPSQHHHFPNAVFVVKVYGEIATNKVCKKIKEWSMRKTTR